MGLKNLFKKEEKLIGVDIGSTSIKLIELEPGGKKPRLLTAGTVPVKGDLFASNAVSNSSKVAEYVTALLEANSVSDRRVVTAVPGPSVFTKKIKVPKMGRDELATHIQFEAGNFIPHNVNAVRLDYHVIGASGKNQLDVLVVAVKNEIIDGFLDSFGLAGLEVAVVDVDHFAVQNMFELCYPELAAKTVALVNVGARYSSINVCRNGDSLFTGDVPVGGRLFTEAIAEAAKVSMEEAEEIKKDRGRAPDKADVRQEALDRNVEYVASEFNRQLSFFWNASGSEEGIDTIMLTGGGALVPGLVEELSEKTGLECSVLDPFRGVECGEGQDPKFLAGLAPVMSVAVGLGLRRAGDRSAEGLE